MRYFMTWLMGFLPGVPVGAGVVFLYRRFIKQQCKYVVQKEEKNMMGTELIMSVCPGEVSSLCVEKLCPRHCEEMHQQKCKQVAFRKHAA